MKVVVLGAGRVGKAMALDLARDGDFQVTVVDQSAKALGPLEGVENVSVRRADLSEATSVGEVVRDQDLCVGAVPGFLGFQTLQAILEAGKPAVDIAFFPEDPFKLDELARLQGLVAVVDAGIAPGCSNLILGHHETEMDETYRFECRVGGLPIVRHWPFQYQAPFSPVDVIEEYVRPARIRRNGKTVVVPALSEVEDLDHPELGALEAFNTDGLRTLLRTCETPEMLEKTVRYPGHAEWMRGLRDVGFFSEKPMRIGDHTVSPLEITSRLLEGAWAFGEGEEDLTVMQVEVQGRTGEKKERHHYTLLDRYDAASDISSMARTTGYTCTAMVRMLAQGLYTRPGITPPELVGADPDCFRFVLSELEARGVRFDHQVEELDG